MEAHAESNESSKPKKRHICSTCGSTFTKPSDLIRHERTHTGEKPFRCDECGTFFSQASSLKIHLRKHSGEKPFQCQYCHHAFAHSHRLKSHVRKFHAFNRLPCSVCGSNLESQCNLNSHNASSHSSKFEQTFENIPEEEEKDHKCGNRIKNVDVAYPPKPDILLAEKSNSEISRISKSKEVNIIKRVEQISPPNNHRHHSSIIAILRSTSETSPTFNSSLDSSPTHGSLMCEICGSLYSNNAMLERHLKDNHDIATTFNAASSASNLNFINTAIDSNSSELSPGPASNGKKYLKTAHSPCQKTYSNMRSSRNIRVNVCKFCGSSFSTTKSYNRHLLSHLSSMESLNANRPTSPVFVIQEASINKGLRLSTSSASKNDPDQTQMGNGKTVVKGDNYSYDHSKENTSLLVNRNILGDKEYTDGSASTVGEDFNSPSTPPLSGFDSFPTFQDLAEKESLPSQPMRCSKSPCVDSSLDEVLFQPKTFNTPKSLKMGQLSKQRCDQTSFQPFEQTVRYSNVIDSNKIGDDQELLDLDKSEGNLTGSSAILKELCHQDNVSSSVELTSENEAIEKSHFMLFESGNNLEAMSNSDSPQKVTVVEDILTLFDNDKDNKEGHEKSSGLKTSQGGEQLNQTYPPVRSEEDVKSIQGTETSLNCANCPLGLFDASVIEVMCQDECLGDVIERNFRADDNNLVRPLNSTCTEYNSMDDGMIENKTSNLDLTDDMDGLERNAKQSGDTFSEKSSSALLDDEKNMRKLAQVPSVKDFHEFIQSDEHQIESNLERLEDSCKSSPAKQQIRAEVPSLRHLAKESVNSSSARQSTQNVSKLHTKSVSSLTKDKNDNVSEYDRKRKALVNRDTQLKLIMSKTTDATLQQGSNETKAIRDKSNVSEAAELQKKLMHGKLSSKKNRLKESIRWAFYEQKCKECYTNSDATHNMTDMYHQLHLKHGSFPCNQCSANFHHLVKLRRHQRIHSKPNNKAQSDDCKICHLSFVFQNTLKNNLKSVSKGESNTSIKLLEMSPFTNTIEKGTSERSILSIYDSGKQREISSSVSNKDELSDDSGNQKTSLSNHQSLKAKGKKIKQKLYLCQYCGISMPKLHQFNSHMKKHVGKPQYNCDVCPGVFSKKFNLAKHKIIHSGQRPHQCELCPKSFTQLSNLHIHMRIHTGERPFSCEPCQASFAHSQALRLHMRFHAKDKRFVCQTCGKGFVVKAALEKHRQSHTKEKLYVCDICNAKLSSKSSLSRHAKKHKLGQGLLLFSCSMCPVKFAQSGHLKLHLKSHPLKMKSGQ